MRITLGLPKPNINRMRPYVVRGRPYGTLTTGHTSKFGMNDEEAQAVRAEGFDPDDPAVVAAIDVDISPR
jgi:hypothetical protein